MSEISEDGFYRSPDTLLCQGDIVYGVPHVHFKPPFTAVRKQTVAGGREAFLPAAEVSHRDLPDLQRGDKVAPGWMNLRDGVQVLTRSQIGLGMVLPYDCDIDNDGKHRLVALIRRLDPAIPDVDKAIIRENRNSSFFYLPAYGDIMPESYVDLRRISKVGPEFLDHGQRVASITEAAVRQLHSQLFLFLTHRELHPDVISTLDRLTGSDSD